MKTKLKLITICHLLAAICLPAFAQGTAFTYQGRLNDGSNPASGIYDLRFAIYDAVSSGAQQGNLLTNSPTAVSNGLFTVALDFGNQFPGADRWLEIGVRTNGGGSFTTLSPRQKLTPTPYAIFAGNVGAGGLTAGTYGNAVTFSNAGSSFTGNGSGLANVNALTLGGVGSNGFWRTTGNAGTTPGINYLGTSDNQPLELQVNGVRALRLEPNGGAAPNVIGGYYQNIASGLHGVAIAGGGTSAALNQALGNYAFIGAGYGASAGNSSAVLSGAYNNAPGNYGFIGTGLSNTNMADYSFIGDGTNNLIQTSSDFSFIGGGEQNVIQNSSVFAVIAGGAQNNIGTNAGAADIAGGIDNIIEANSGSSSIGGGAINRIQSGSIYCVIAGGINNLIQTSANSSTIGGGDNNRIQPNDRNSTIGGGSDNTILDNAQWSTIGGGVNNVIQPNAQWSTIGGGVNNFIQPNANSSTIGGGVNNMIQTGAFSTIGGGDHNTASGSWTVVAGGQNNIVTNSYAFIGGGIENTNFGLVAVIGGGENNFVNGIDSTVGGGGGNSATGSGATVAGGQGNTASGYAGTVGGGVNNQAAQNYSTVPGGFGNVASGQFSFAAGNEAQALHSGAFVWADSQLTPFASTASDQFLIRAQGGVGIGTGSPRAQLNVNGTARIDAASTAYNEGLTLNLATDMPGGGYGGIHFHNAARGGAYGSSTIKWGMFYNYAPGLGGIGGGGLAIVQNNVTTRLNFATNGSTTFYSNPGQTAGVTLAAGGGAWTTLSDRNAKENFQPVNSTEVLAKVATLPLTTWNYKSQDARIHHLGPMAQDFKAAFGLGESDTGITTVDADGVALAAIQGLNQKMDEFKMELDRRDAENAELKQTVANLKQMVLQLAQTKSE